MPELKLYTVADLREWLENNRPAEGLSERVIAPTRAWAIIHNPYVKDEDAIVAAIFEDGELAAYTASFPDMLDGKRVWWASTLHCYPLYEGRGYGLVALGTLKEAHEPDLTYDRWGAKETVEIFNHFGYPTIYTKRYHYGVKKINTKILRGKLLYCVQALTKYFHPWPKLSQANYTLQYVSYFDGEAYAFLQVNRGKDLWVREQKMLNWMLRYPFYQGSSLLNRVREDTLFTAYVIAYEYKVVKVFVKDVLQGVYLIRYSGSSLSIVYLYYAIECRDLVYTSIVDHIISAKPDSFVTEHEDLFTYIRERLFFPSLWEEWISLSLPCSEEFRKGFTLQLGDGDSFA